MNNSITFNKYLEYDKEIKALTAKKKALYDKITSNCEPNKPVKIGNYLVKFAVTISKRLNTKLLKEKETEKYNEYLMEIESKRLTIKEI